MAKEETPGRVEEELEKRAAAGVFGYPAGKSIIVDKLVPLVPPHAKYTELFVGSGAMFFAKPDADSSVINDLDPEVADVYRCMKGCSDADIARLQKMDWKGSKAVWQKLKDAKPTDSVAKIHKFLYLTRFSYGRMRGKSYDPNSDGVVARAAGRVAFARGKLQKCEIVSKHYGDPLSEHDGKNAFHFLDPPYAGYDVNIGEKKFDEGEFRKRLKALKGKFLLTYGVKGKLDTSGFNVKRLRQPRTIRAMRGVGGSKFLTHLLVTNYDLSKKGVEKLLKALGPGYELDDVEAIIDEVDGQRTHVFLSGTATPIDPAGDTGTYLPPCDAAFGISLEKELPVSARLVGGDPWGTLNWQLEIVRAGDVPALDELAKSYSVHGDRHFRALTLGVPAHEHAEGTPLAGAVLHRVTVECGLQTEDLREYFVSKGSYGDPLLLGVLRIEKVGEEGGWVARLVQDDLVPGALRLGAPMPPPGAPAIPKSLADVVPAELQYWRARGEEAQTKRDALIESGFFAHGSVALVDGAFARVVRKVYLYEPPRPTTRKAELGWEQLLGERLPEGTALREVFALGEKHIAKAGEDEVLYHDACEVAEADLGNVVERALMIPGPFVLSAVDAPGARAAFGKVGRPFRFVPGAGGAPIDAVKRLFVASFGLPRVDGITWADVIEKATGRELLVAFGPPNEWSGAVAAIAGADNRRAMREAWDAMSAPEREQTTARWERAMRKDDLGTDDLAGAGLLPAATQPEDSLEACVAARVASGMSPDQAEAACRRQMKGWIAPVTKGRVFRLLKNGEGDEQFTLCVVLAPEEEDAQHDVYSAAEIRQAAHKFMERYQNVGFMHEKLINKRAAIVESYLAPTDLMLGSEKVTKGTWLLGHHVLDGELWGMIKRGEITGLSIGGSAVRTPTGKSDGTKKTVDFQGLKIAIDRPKGFKQELTLPNGDKKTRVYTRDYGEIPGTLGGDGEGLDVFIGDDAASPDVFWFIQRKRGADGTGWKFDEYKLVVGERSAQAATKIYVAHIPEEFIAGVVKTTWDMVKALRGLEPTEVVKALDRISGRISVS